MIVGGGFEKCSDLTLVALLAGHMTAPGRVLGQPVCFDCPTKSCQEARFLRQCLAFAHRAC